MKMSKIFAKSDFIAASAWVYKEKRVPSNKNFAKIFDIFILFPFDIFWMSQFQKDWLFPVNNSFSHVPSPS